MDCTFAPQPPGSAYSSVWAGEETTLTARFYPRELTHYPLAAGREPHGADTWPAEVRFTDDDGHGPTTVRATLQRTGPDEWRASFVLPHPGRWQALGACSPAFALRVVQRGRVPSHSGNSVH